MNRFQPTNALEAYMLQGNAQVRHTTPHHTTPQSAPTNTKRGAPVRNESPKLTADELRKQQAKQAKLEYNDEIKKIASLSKPQMRKWVRMQTQLDDESDDEFTI